MKTSSPSPLRREIARTACREVSVLANMLQEYSEKHCDGETGHAVRGSLMRLSVLSGIILEAVIYDRPEETDDELVRKIGGMQTLADIEEGASS